MGQRDEPVTCPIFMSRFCVHELEWRYGFEGMGVVVNLRLFLHSFDFARMGLCLAVVVNAYKENVARVF